MELDREAILKGIPKPTVVPVEIPDGTLYVRSLTVGEQDRLALYSRQQADGKAAGHGWRALLMALGICKPDGSRMFTDADAHALCQYPAEIADKIVQAIESASGLGPKATEEIAKN